MTKGGLLKRAVMIFVAGSLCLAPKAEASSISMSTRAFDRIVQEMVDNDTSLDFDRDFKFQKDLSPWMESDWLSEQTDVRDLFDRLTSQFPKQGSWDVPVAWSGYPQVPGVAFVPEQSAPVPEPATLLLMGSGLAMWAARKRPFRS